MNKPKLLQSEHFIPKLKGGYHIMDIKKSLIAFSS